MNFNRPSKPNELINEKSVYLRENAYSQINWHSWCEEAFNQAKSEDKPVLISIGYFSDYYSKKIEYESFNQEEIIDILNNYFICIKVDKEERPDIANAYMQVCELLGSSCKWPLTIFATPDKKPFLTSFYFSKESSTLIGVKDLLMGILTSWHERRNEIEDIAQSIEDSIRIISRVRAKAIDEDTARLAYLQIIDTYLEGNWKSRDKPIFLSPISLLFLMRFAHRTKELNALKIVRNTLYNMRYSILYDQIGYGFFKVRTDKDKWIHLEKILYEQGLMLITYVEAYKITKDPLFKEVSEEIIEYLMRNIVKGNGFYASESGYKVESYYSWTESEIRKILPKDDAEFILEAYSLLEESRKDAPGVLSSLLIPFFAIPVKKIALKMGIDEEIFYKKLKKISKVLFEYREQRTHPQVDKKTLTDWNSIAIIGLLKAAKAFNNEEYRYIAESATKYFIDKIEDNTIFHVYNGKPIIKGFLEDYAYFINCLTELYETTFNEEYLRLANALADKVINNFWDSNSGGFYQTDKDSEIILTRIKNIRDMDYISGNSIMMENLLRLYHYSENEDYYDKAIKIIESFSYLVGHQPINFLSLMHSLEYILNNNYEIYIIGDRTHEHSNIILEMINSKYLPNSVIIMIDKDTNREILPEYAKNLEMIHNEPTVYVFKNHKLHFGPADNIPYIAQILSEL